MSYLRKAQRCLWEISFGRDSDEHFRQASFANRCSAAGASAAGCESTISWWPREWGAPPPRVPRGIYAVAPVETVLKQGYVNLTVPGFTEVAGYGRIPPPSTPGLASYLGTFYTGLLMNPAVSGLTLQVHWDTLNPNPPTDANA